MNTFPDLHWGLGFYLKSLVSTDTAYKYPVQGRWYALLEEQTQLTRQKQ